MRNKKLAYLTVPILLSCVSSSALGVASRHPSAPATFDGTLSLLTYNVKGSPWPIASGRPADLDAIAARLRTMRASGQNPGVVVLQEAFDADAKAIAGKAGYRYVVDGPAADQRDAIAPTPADKAYLAGRSWSKGETGYRAFDSGLQILSDYPVIGVHRMAYPDFACAGYDCLANKGAVIVTLQLPGAASPVDVITTHFNSRHSSGVSDTRSLYAYTRQAELLADFVRQWHNPAHPLIVAGDFNVGKAAPRWQALSGEVARWGTGGTIDNAMGAVARTQSGKLPGDVAAVIKHNCDWEFYAAGTAARLVPQSVKVTFGTEANGAMLSDHMGYTAAFRLVGR